MRDDYFIIDTHHHVGHLDILRARQSTTETAEPGAEQIELRTRLSVMDGDGVDQSIVIPSHGYLRAHGLQDTMAINDQIARYRDETPNRFVGALGIVEPLYGKDGLPELERIKSELGLLGVTFHTRFQGVSTASPLVHQLVQRMGELGLVPFVHAINEVIDESLFRTVELARAFPDVTMVVLDAFSSAHQSANALTIAEFAPNLVFDTSLSFSNQTASQFVQFVRRHGVDRLVFGTDLYSYPSNYRRSIVLENLLASSLEPHELEAVLSGNIRRILNLET